MSKNPRIEIIAVGSELLSPFFQDTNSMFISGRLNDIGLQVNTKCQVGDDWNQLHQVISQGVIRADLLFTIGGLGPTEDDITKEAVASVLGKKLVFKKDLLNKIQARFRRRGIPMPELNKKQAYVIEDSIVLENAFGTAPGQWITTETCMVVLLPGPPHELKPMFDDHVYPLLRSEKKRYSDKKILKITGLTESKVNTLIQDLYPETSEQTLSILAHPGQIEIHITGFSSRNESSARASTERLAEKIAERLGEHVFSQSGEDLEALICRILTEKNQTLAVAESCTGGLLGNRITNIPGSSQVFLAGVVTYSNRAKVDLAEVPEDLIERHGAVSSEVAEAMADGIRTRTDSDYGIAITGIAGPGGETPDKPVGLVYTALSWADGAWIEKEIFLGNRKIIKFQSTQKALDMLRRHLLFGQESTMK